MKTTISLSKLYHILTTVKKSLQFCIPKHAHQWFKGHPASSMENYLLCGAVSNLNSPSSAKFQNNVVTLYKGRKRGTVEFVGIWRHSRAAKDLVTNNVSPGDASVNCCNSAQRRYGRSG